MRKLFWSAFYRLLGAEIVVRCSVWTLRLLGTIGGRQLPAKVVGEIESRLIHSGWPHHGTGWVNLDVSRFAVSLSRDGVPVAQKAPPVWSAGWPRRIGIVGRFVGHFGFPTALFEACPASVELVVFDIEHRGRHADYLRSVVTEYHALSLDDARSYLQQLNVAAGAINSASLDVLVSVGWKRDAYDVLDRVRTACIASYCVGSDLLHHPNVDFYMYGQPQADYPLNGTYLYNSATGRRFTDRPVYSVTGYFDPRELQHLTAPAWKSRDPLIVIHGSLDKLEDLAFRQLVMGLLADDSNLTCVLAGKDNGRALALLQLTARELGVEKQVHYGGSFSGLRGTDGHIDDPGWKRLVSLLGRARLSPDPWPVGGGSSRVESYLLGTPCVHMGVRFDPASWGRPQYSECEVPALLIPTGTAYSWDEYRSLCKQCLYDQAFADALVAEQMIVGKRVTDAAAWWQDLLRFCTDWRQTVQEAA